MRYTVGEVARISGVSVRALHHYDEIGLVRPSSRSRAGYRLYTVADLERLQQVLFYRELGFALDEIARALTDPAFDRRKALTAQRARLVERADRARALVDLVDRTLRALEGKQVMEPKQMFEGFDPGQYEDEVKSRWGETEAYRESQRRTRSYGKEQWAEIRAEWGEIAQRFAKAFADGAPADSARAMDVAEEHRRHVDRWYYPCSHEMHEGLGEMYVADDRFAANYEKHAAGLTPYVRDAIRANAARARG